MGAGERNSDGREGQCPVFYVHLWAATQRKTSNYGQGNETLRGRAGGGDDAARRGVPLSDRTGAGARLVRHHLSGRHAGEGERSVGRAGGRHEGGGEGVLHEGRERAGGEHRHQREQGRAVRRLQAEVPKGSRELEPPAPSPHREGAGDVRGQRDGLLCHGILRGRVPQRAGGQARRPAGGGGRRIRRANRRGVGVHARPQDAAPRREAGERHAAGGRERGPHRLRAVEAVRRERRAGVEHLRRRRNAGVRPAGTGAVPRGAGLPRDDGRVRAGGDAVQAADGRAAAGGLGGAQRRIPRRGVAAAEGERSDHSLRGEGYVAAEEGPLPLGERHAGRAQRRSRPGRRGDGSGR